MTRRQESRLAPSIAFASGRAPEHVRDARAEVASPPAIEANASLPRIVAIENPNHRRFR